MGVVARSPWTTERVVGTLMSAMDGCVTVSVKPALEEVTPVPAAVICIGGCAPAAAVLLTAIVAVADVVAPASELGLNVTVTPAGTLLAVSVTAPV